VIGALYGTQHFVQDVFSYNDYHGAHGHATLRPPRTDFPYFVSEAVSKAGRRTAPMIDQQTQAMAHAWVHEIAASDRRYCGLLAWLSFDYVANLSGSKGVIDFKYTGVTDVFRVPKPGAAIYQSQIDPTVRPVIAPAFYWDFGKKSLPYESGRKAMICSNCERLKLFVDGRFNIQIEPDRQRFGHLSYPPSFVDLNHIDGATHPELRIDGYVGGKRVASRRFSSDPAGDTLAVQADDKALIANGSDATRVVFRAIDRYGASRPYVNGNVRISVDGPAKLVGESSFDFADAGGVGAAWIRTIDQMHGKIRVKVSHSTLGGGEVVIHAHQGAGDDGSP
jgi:beta-galactosidase